MNSLLAGIMVSLPLIFGTPKVEIIKPPVINKQDIVLSYYIEKLAYCESRNNPEAYNPKDSNNLPSHGYLQFQKGTWIEGIKKYKILSNTEEDEYMNLIYDKDIQ